MITPLFSITQTESELEVRVRAPHSRPRDIQLYVNGTDFNFHCSPYLLQLRLSHPVYLAGEDEYDDGCFQPNHTTYNIDTGIACVTLTKKLPGTHFERLDLLSTLLISSPPNKCEDLEPSRQPNPSIEVLSSEETPLPEEQTSATLNIEDLNTQFNKEITDVSGLPVALRELSIGRPRYGFGDRYEAVFSVRAEDTSEIVELPDPDSTPVWRRPGIRKMQEDEKFDPDHYIADYMLESELEPVLQYVVPHSEQVAALTENQIDIILKLPQREYLSDVDETAAADLAGILYASAFDVRTTLGERNVMSAWTISCLNVAMSFLEHMPSPRMAVLAAYRRSLAYPLYRSCKVGDAVLGDLKNIFKASSIEILRSRLLRMLLELREIFEESLMHRLHCDIFLTDYCVWIQKVKDSVLSQLQRAISEIEISRSEIGWDLSELESNAERIANGEEIEEDEEDDVHEGESNGPAESVPQVVGQSKEIVISASCGIRKPGLEMVPVSSRMLKDNNAISTEEDDSSSMYSEESSSDSESDSS